MALPARVRFYGTSVTEGTNRLRPGWVGAVSDRMQRLLHEHERINDTRQGELAAHWTRYNIQIVFNTGILYAFVSDRRSVPVWLWITFGISAAWVWYSINARGHRWVGFWNRSLRELEALAGLPSVYQNALRETRRPLPMVTLSALLPLLFTGAWAALAFLHSGDWLLRSVAGGAVLFMLCRIVREADRTMGEGLSPANR